MFILSSVLINWLEKVNLKNYESFHEKSEFRSDLLYEVLPNMKQVKAASYETYFSQIFENIRISETKTLHKIQSNNALINFLKTAVPMLANFYMIWIYMTNDEDGTVNAIFVYNIIYYLGGLASRLYILSNVWKYYNQFKKAYDSLNMFIYGGDDKPEVSYQNPN